MWIPRSLYIVPFFSKNFGAKYQFKIVFGVMCAPFMRAFTAIILAQCEEIRRSCLTSPHIPQFFDNPCSAFCAIFNDCNAVFQGEQKAKILARPSGDPSFVLAARAKKHYQRTLMTPLPCPAD